MAERLTDKDYFAWHYRCGYQNKKDSLERTQKEHKLGKFEDVMEKYGIESVEELEKEMHSLMLIISVLNDYGIEDYNELDEILKEFSYMKKMETEIGKELKFYKTDRDTWKRACELASETLKQVMGKPLWIGGNIPTPEVKDSDYFYQQAKKEGENNDTNN